MINKKSKTLKIDNKLITNCIIWLNRKSGFQNIINKLFISIQRIFKKRFKSSKKCKVRRNVLKGKNLELFKDDNWTKAGR